eukprot:s45_g41.t1
MEARWPPRSQQLFGAKPSSDQAPPLDPLLSDQLSSMGQEISHLLLRAGPPKEFEVLRPAPLQPAMRRSPMEEPSKVPGSVFSPRATMPSLPPKSEKVLSGGHPPEAGPVTSMCSRCHVLNMQVRALAQSLAGLGAKAFNWSTGLGKLQRRDLAEVVLEYCRPCAHLDTTLEGLCIDLENIHWGEVASLGCVAQLAPPPDWMAQAREAETQTTPRTSTAKATKKEEVAKESAKTSLAKGGPAAAAPASAAPVPTADTGAAPERRSHVQLPLDSKSQGPGASGAVQQRLQGILQQGQQQRLDVDSLQELQKLLSVVAETRPGADVETGSVNDSDYSPKDISSPVCPHRSSSPRALTRPGRPNPENHDLPLLVPRQQDLPPRHPPALQAPLTPHPAVGPATPRSARSATPPPSGPAGTLMPPQRALGREAKTCSDLLGDVKPAGDPLPPEEVLSVQPAEVPRLSGYAPSELWDSHRPSGFPQAEASVARVSGMPAETQSQGLSGMPPEEQQRLSGQAEAQWQRLSGVPPAEAERQRLSGMPAEPQSQRLSGMPSGTQSQRPSGVPPDSQRLSGMPVEQQSQRLSGMPSGTQSQRPSGVPHPEAESQRLSGSAALIFCWPTDFWVPPVFGLLKSH